MAITAEKVGALGGATMWAGEVTGFTVPQWTASPIPVPATTAGGELPPGQYRVHMFTLATSPIIVTYFLGQQCPSKYSQVGILSTDVTLTAATVPQMMATNNGQGDRPLEWALCIAYPLGGTA
ncbi:hypothetical protein [Tomitella gaofuii]|uniref:hypothetical protein n=1 Tax=Tomitella gaofuii TaxID=2760083 RepID=UPI0015FD46CB|nr:hypothetical protein [Tomitella gaofuii]